MKTTTNTQEEILFGNRKINEIFELFHQNQWIKGQKIDQFKFKKINKQIIKTSVWTKTR